MKTQSTQPKFWHGLFWLFWPPVTDPKYRKTAIWAGAGMVFFSAIIWGCMMLFGLIVGTFTQNLESIYTGLKAAIPFLLGSFIGWGILKKSKAATIVGLSIAFVSLIINCFTRGLTISNLVIDLIMIHLLIHSTRGIFAHYEATKDQQTEKQTSEVKGT